MLCAFCLVDTIRVANYNISNLLQKWGVYVR